MQSIKFYPEIFKKILDGSKKATLRLGIKGYRLGLCKMQEVDVGGRKLVEWTNTRIILIEIIAFEELTTYHARIEGYSSVTELRAVLRSIYPNIDDCDEMTLVRFE